MLSTTKRVLIKICKSSPPSCLPRWHLIRPIARSRELGRTISIPSKWLCSDGSSTPSISGIPHAVIHNPVFGAIRTLGEACMTNTIRLCLGVLVEDTPLVVLTPIGWVHWVITNELELAEAVVAVVRASCTVDYELLTCGGIGELLWAFVGGKTLVEGTTVRCLLPRVVRRTDDLAFSEVAFDSPRIRHLSNAEIGWPCIVLTVPTTVDVVKSRAMLEVGTINRELIISVELRLESVCRVPRI